MRSIREMDDTDLQVFASNDYSEAKIKTKPTVIKKKSKNDCGNSIVASSIQS